MHMNYYNSMYGVQPVAPVVYQQPYGYPQTTAQQMMMQQQQPVVQPVQQTQVVQQQPVVQPVQQAVVQQPVVSAATFSGIVVNDFEDVKNYPCTIGGITLLLNKKDKKFYIKSLNEQGIPMIETYNFDSASAQSVVEEQPVQQNNQYSDAILQKLEAIERKLKVE